METTLNLNVPTLSVPTSELLPSPEARKDIASAVHDSVCAVAGNPIDRCIQYCIAGSFLNFWLTGVRYEIYSGYFYVPKGGPVATLTDPEEADDLAKLRGVEHSFAAAVNQEKIAVFDLYAANYPSHAEMLWNQKWGHEPVPYLWDLFENIPSPYQALFKLCEESTNKVREIAFKEKGTTRQIIDMATSRLQGLGYNPAYEVICAAARKAFKCGRLSAWDLPAHMI